MNCKFLKFCWFPILLFFFNSQSFAQKNDRVVADSSIAAVDEDSLTGDYGDETDTLITRTAFDDTNDSIVKWKRAREFSYMAYLDSLLRKKTDLRIDTVNIDKGKANKNRVTTGAGSAANSNSFLNSLPVKAFFWIIAVFFIGFLLYKLFLTGGIFEKGNAKANDEPSSKEPEQLNEYSEYNVLIHEAELKNNFNLSIRYLYLQSLKKLADSGLIIFSPDKTNNLYVKELAGRRQQQDFAFLTLNYEYIWYGRFIIDITQYQRLKNEFILFNKTV